MARAIDKRIMLDLIIEAKKTDPETGPFRSGWRSIWWTICPPSPSRTSG